MWLVPALRFPEFTEEWEEHYLAEYLDFKNGLNPSANKFGSGIKFISVMDILNNDFITYDCIRTSVEITPEEQVAFAVEKGDMLFQRSSETLEDVGRANVYMDDRPAVFGGFVIRGKKKAEYNPMFFRYLLASPYARKKVIPMGAGAQHFNIGQDGLSKVKLHFPILQEQQKIADLLRLINERISTQNKIIEKLQSLIKGLVDELMTVLLKGKLYPFSSFYIKAGEGGTPTTSVVEYYTEGTIPFIKIEDLSCKYLTNNKDFITELGMQKSSAWLIPSKSVIYSNGATIGAISINEYPVCTKQGILGIVPNTNINVEYLYLLMSSSYFSKEISRIITEGTMKTAYLKDINHIKCPLPSMAQQKNITNLTSSIEEKLSIEQELLRFLNLQKQYLLRRMFI
ncbi:MULTISPECIES: restriction endonuclease subunit S [Bacteroides]|uniref:Restriction endonuclease subunit S n=3 Tax=Bacteroides TaxID=816 RepID=A0A6L4NCS5_9BACE|nr:MULTISPECIES: restriction endonuclease subunit S [Bacteroides]KAA5250983.1 restriction endonuclease subunit S [Bacteroides finegoldii]KAB6080016.1 restriction endonuclease subunit S [Bacteroides xylanisolvens]KAB6097236.1 restriction endonuclease subunit S [Bacteroides xylanisolvens]KAB6112878.1 restriction endonuclease subunit S [Bacteroides xylanisolvens]RYT18811.1 restriction endonuclease subunit S [Bacteroides xylanisolvens]